MDQPKPPPEVWVVAVVRDPEEAIRRPGHERKDRSQIRRKSRAKKVKDLQKKKKYSVIESSLDTIPVEAAG